MDVLALTEGVTGDSEPPVATSGGTTTSERQPLVQEQLRLHQVQVTVDLGGEEPVVLGNSIQLEQVFINLLTNARDAVRDSPRKAIRISASVGPQTVEVA